MISCRVYSWSNLSVKYEIVERKKENWRSSRKRMAEVVTLNKAIRDLVVKQLFTQFPGMPTWLRKMRLIKDMEEVAMRCKVSYLWVGDHGLLSVVDGA